MHKQHEAACLSEWGIVPLWFGCATHSSIKMITRDFDHQKLVLNCQKGCHVVGTVNPVGMNLRALRGAFAESW